MKRTVKAKTSKVDDYFDFSFRVESSEKVEKSEETPVLKIEEEPKAEHIAEVSNFDNEAKRIIMVARLGSLFDCDKRMINV